MMIIDFKVLREERISEDGKVAVDMAEAAWGQGEFAAVDRFLVTAIRFDKLDDAKRLKRLEVKLEEKDRQAKELGSLSKLRVVGGNAD